GGGESGSGCIAGAGGRGESAGGPADVCEAGADDAGALQQPSVDAGVHQCVGESVLCCVGCIGAVHDQGTAAGDVHDCRGSGSGGGEDGDGDGSSEGDGYGGFLLLGCRAPGTGVAD